MGQLREVYCVATRKSQDASRKINRISRAAFHVLDYLIVLRPTLLFPVWTLVLLGHYHGALQSPSRTDTTLSRLTISSESTIGILLHLNPRLWGTICLYSMLAGAAYIINQIVDRETDEANNKLYLVAQGHVKLAILKFEAAFLLVAATVWAIVWFHDNVPYLMLIALSILLGVVYSVRPFRLKGKPLLDLLANAIGYGAIAFLIGWATASPINANAIWRTLPYTLCVGAAFVNTTLPDLKGDRAYGDRTIGVLLGVQRSCQLSLILLAGAILSAWLFKDSIALITGLFCLPFFVYINFNRRKSAIILATRIGILTLSLLACIVIPYYFILFIGTLLFVRWYYAVRFGMRYPF
ncbi:MAG: UbiA family prenyltransferase [Candidatus Poribacteria bacterium]|nr:UbiA family prenyltransferase [Candidatus Poribacteria bacterium]